MPWVVPPTFTLSIIQSTWIVVHFQQKIPVGTRPITQVQLREDPLPSPARDGADPASLHVGFQNFHLFPLWTHECQEHQSQPCLGDQSSGRAGEDGAFLMGRALWGFLKEEKKWNERKLATELTGACLS